MVVLSNFRETCDGFDTMICSQKLSSINCMKTPVWIEKDLSGQDSDHRLVMTNKERGENN